MATLSKRNFTRGIFSPVVQSRRDVDAWQAGAHRLVNVTLMKHGGVRKRMGTELVYVQPVDDDQTRMLPFTYSTGQSYALLMGQATMRPLALGGAVLSAGFGITGITRANPAVVTAPFHALTAGQEVYFGGIAGMIELNGRVARVVGVLDANNFSIGIDTTGFGEFTADDGTVRIAAPPPPPPPPTVPDPTPPPDPPPTVPPGGGGGGRGRDDEGGVPSAE